MNALDDRVKDLIAAELGVDLDTVQTHARIKDLGADSTDLIALTFPGNPLDSRYQGSAKVNVRNVDLPASYNHITAPLTRDLAADAKVRDWINAFVPGREADLSTLPDYAQSHILWAADVWHSIKKHWTLEAQALIRARRVALGRP